MRDPQRIKRILALLEKAWQEVPDLRLGQLIENIAKELGWNDAFYMEDDVLQKELRKRL